MLYDGFYLGNQLISLSPNEYKILDIIIKNKNRIIEFKEIQKQMNLSKQDIYVYIYRLRKKLKGEFKIYTKYDIGVYI